ncbi:MAG: hypothetical protein M0Z54_10250 [Thermaerobacter sp.]|nr:hypothetical protein [Thermaerobacter sp.]
MRRPVTSLLLLVFSVATLYVARPVRPPATVPVVALVQKVLPVPTVVVARPGGAYLVGEHQAWQAGGTSTVDLKPTVLRWVDIPQPSGAGVWRLAELPNGHTLFGLGGPVYPRPERAQTLLLDPGTRHLYEVTGATMRGTDPPTAVAPTVQVSGVRWAPTGQFAVIVGAGPDGMGLYRWSPQGGTTWLGAAPNVQQWAALAEPVVVTTTGDIWWVGHRRYALHLTGATVSPGGIVLGFAGGDAVWWAAGHTANLKVPGLPLATPQFSSNGGAAAYVTQVGRASELIVMSGRGVVASRALPGRQALAPGWIGRRVVIAVLSGSDRGTYLVSP